MTEKASSSGISQRVSIFTNIGMEISPALIAFFQLAEPDGAYASLPLLTRQVFEMRYVEGLDLAQIGDEIGLSSGAVGQRLRAAPADLLERMSMDPRFKGNISYETVLDAYAAIEPEYKPKPRDPKRERPGYRPRRSWR
jgi:hypothetical protein